MGCSRRVENYLEPFGLSCAISEAILDSLKPSWSHPGPYWKLKRLAKRPLQVQGEGVGGGGTHPQTEEGGWKRKGVHPGAKLQRQGVLVLF